MHAEFLIIGGGPAGATAAAVLARAGRDVIVVEKSVFPRRKVCGEFIAASGAAVLDDLGLKPRFDAIAGPEVRHIALWIGHRAFDAAMPGTQFPRALARAALDTMLLEEAARRGAHIVRSDAGIEARTVIEASGSWRRNAEARPSDLFGFQAHLSGGEPPRNAIALIPFPGGYGGLVERAGGHSTFACCIRRDQLQGIRQPGLSAGESVLAHAMHHCRLLAAALRSARLEEPWLGAGPLHPGRRPLYRDGVFAVGNAAGEAHPVVGEGIAMALQSGALLARVLLEHSSHERAAMAYARGWRRLSPRLRASALFAHLAMLPIAPMLGALLGLAPGLLTAAAKMSGKASRAAAA